METTNRCEKVLSLFYAMELNLLFPIQQRSPRAGSHDEGICKLIESHCALKTGIDTLLTVSVLSSFMEQVLYRTTFPSLQVSTT